MTQQIINIGSAELQGDGESIRSAFNKVNSNFTEIYSISHTGNISFTGTVMYSNSGLTISNQGTSTGATAVITLPSNAGYNLGLLNNYGVISLTAAADPDSQKTWTFTTSGSLTAPGHIIPTDNLSYDLGSTSSQWRSLYVGTSTIYLGGTALSVAGGILTVDGSPVGGNDLQDLTISGSQISSISGVVELKGSVYAQLTGALENNVFVNYAGAQINLNTGTTIWTFDTNGLLTLPSGNTTIGNLYGSDAILCSTGTAFGIVSQGAGSSVLQWLDDVNAPNVIAGIAVNSLYSNTGSVQIYTGAIGSPPQNTWTFGTDSRLVLPGGSSINVSTYDVSLVAGDDGSSTYGHVTLKTNGPNGVNEFYMNSLGELTLPRGGVIQETEVMNELWGTTTTSLTLVPAGANNGTQRLEIYSTGGGEGDHIHITSGDQNVTDVFLGNDTQYFAVGAMGQNEIRARRGLDSPSPGTSAYAGSPVWIYAGDAGDNGGSTADGAPGGDVLIIAGIASDGLGGEIILASGNGPTGHGSIKLSTDGGSGHLEFDKDDQLTFPSGGGIIFDSSATSTITGISSVIFADSTEQTTAWVAGGSSSLATTFISVNDFPNASFINSSSVSLNYSAYSGGPSFNFTIDCQSPLTENIGIDVGAVKTPYILSTGTVELKTNLGASTSTWIFNTTGELQFPDGTTSTGATVFANSSSYKIQTIWFDGILGNSVSTYEFGADSITIPGNGVIYNAGQEGYWSLDGANQSFTFPNLSRISYGLLNAGLTVDDLKIQAINTGNVVVSANGEDWVFRTNGTLTFPDNTVQSTAFKIGTVPVTSTSTGEVNTIAFNENYLYVCTATNSWQRIGWDVTPW